ncbi:MAG: aspartate aminotransferase family protein [Methanofastidiosum sp.]|jgi:4-aminobutyrate aminotransferase/diaminobutyrate-pyruvate transaminase/4-aminobutyrate aminotransferase/(S)-3-amino-2-methylpropionate transaminase
MYEFNLIPQKVPKVKTKYRNIQTKLPVPESLEIINRSKKYEPESMCGQPLVVWDKAIDYQIYDPYGNIWLDFSSSIFINNIGHGNSDVVSAITEMAKKPLLSSYDYFTEIRSLLAEKLIKMTESEGMDKVFLLSTGSETIECALKLSRLYGLKQDSNKNTVISFEGAFHGKTFGSQMLSGKINDQNIFHLLPPTNHFIQLDEQDDEEYGRRLFYDDLMSLGVDNINKICAFFIESYLGYGAVFHLTGYIKAMREFADSIGALVIADEIQSGFWRTGKLFCYQHYGIKPDIICCGKAISGSLPLSAVLTKAEIMDLDNGLSSTHSGNPVCCAASYANLMYMENNISVEMISKKEKIIVDTLKRWKQKFSDRIISYHGKGMVWGIFVVKPYTEILDIDFVDRVVERCFQKGVILVRTGRGTIKLGMPLTIPEDALIEGLEVIEKSIQEGY